MLQCATLCLLACSLDYEFGQFVVRLSGGSGNFTPKADEFFLLKMASLRVRGDLELQPQSEARSSRNSLLSLWFLA